METSKRSVAEPTETAEYLAGMADEMAETGRRSGLPFLAYLFSMAATEARGIARLRPRRAPAGRPAAAEAVTAAAPLA